MITKFDVEFGTGKIGEANKPESAGRLGIRYKQDKWLANIPNVGVRYVAGMKARPFLYPAFHYNKNLIKDNLVLDLNNLFRRIAK